MIATCKLCLEERELRLSHIIPEFLYKPAYDEKHRASELIVDQAQLRYLQKGLRERLLCDGCEGRIGIYEKYFADAWFQGHLRPERPKGRIVSIAGLDYRLFKLFHLSVVWRAGVSSLEFFELVKLGPHAERIREMLIRGDPGPWERYPFWATLTVDPESRRIIDDLIIEPTRAKVEGHVVYTFSYAGCTWHFFVTSHRPRRKLLVAPFNESGTLTLGVLSLLEDPLVSDVHDRYTSQKAKLAASSKKTRA
jgi:hypothetical protein